MGYHKTRAMIALMGCCIGSMAQPIGLDTLLTAQLQQRAPTTHTVIWVADLAKGKVVLQQHATQSVLPASTQKFLTALAAWRALGPKWRYTTTLSVVGKKTQHRLHGHIVLTLRGDPTLTSKDVLALLNKLKTWGVRRIEGDVYIDSSTFGQQPYPKGVTWDDQTECYAVPHNAAILDENCLHIQLAMQPTYHRPKINISPKKVATVRSLLKAQPATTPCTIDVEASTQNHYTLRGCVRQQAAKWTHNVAVKDMSHYWQRRMATLLQQAGLRYRHIRWQTQPQKQGQPAWQHQSVPLPKLLQTMLKSSNNLMANSLFLTIGQQRFGAGVTWAQARLAVQRALPFAIAPDRLMDGSGMSLYNRLDAATLGQALLYVYQHPALYQQMRAWLAIAGVDGTLKHRFQKMSVRHHFLAKTGTLSGMTGLMGYLNTQQGHHLAVVVFSMGEIDARQAFRAWEDRYIETLYRLA